MDDSGFAKNVSQLALKIGLTMSQSNEPEEISQNENRFTLISPRFSMILIAVFLGLIIITLLLWYPILYLSGARFGNATSADVSHATSTLQPLKASTSPVDLPKPFLNGCIERGVNCSLGLGMQVNGKVRNEFDCQKKCFDDKNCTVWSFSVLSLVCYVKYDDLCEGRVEASERISGLSKVYCDMYPSSNATDAIRASCLSRGRNYKTPTGFREGLIDGVKHEYACHELCFDQPWCQFWTWNKTEAAAGTGSRCTLREDVRIEANEEDIVSGPKYC